MSKEKPMTETQFTKEMNDLDQKFRSDTEARHIEMDNLMVKQLRLLGYHGACDVFERVRKWYA